MPGGATAWQPELADGLDPGANHVWFVRAVFRDEASEVIEAGDWSAGRFFSVPATPSGEQVRQALDVVGISSSPDGAGVAAANTAGGPDLVLDGTGDGETDLAVYQWGIDRASSGIENFALINSIGGAFDLFVQGNVDATAFIGDGAAITNVDADTLDGTDGAAFATDAEAAGLVAAHAVSADHDGRYYTETELNTSGAGGAVNWDNLMAVPAGFADGVDDVTTYSAGLGLIVENGQIRIDQGAFLNRISILDSAGLVGFFTSIAIGADGLGLISHNDSYNGDLNVVHLGIGVPWP